MADKYTRKQFQAQYPDDTACLQAILRRKHHDADKCCPSCGVVGTLSKIEGRRAFACKEGCHIYPCAGTIFDHSPTPLTDWFYAMYLMTATRNGVSAKELQRQLGVTYKCAWRIGHQLRILMAARDQAINPGPLSGHVEVDETYVGGHKHRSKSANYRVNKTMVMGMVQRNGPLKAHVIESNKTMTLVPLVMDTVQTGSKITTDEYVAYEHLNSLGYFHVAIKHKDKEWKNGIHHTNSIEGFWSHLKRGISSTHVSVSKQHMQKYVGEFAFRYNNREAPADMFNRLLKQISRPASS